MMMLRDNERAGAQSAVPTPHCSLSLIGRQWVSRLIRQADWEIK
jgi:hypothetical protein